MEDLTRTSLLLYRYKSIHLYRWHGQVSDPYVTYHPILRSETPHPKMSLVQDLYKHLQSTTLAGQLQGRVSFVVRFSIRYLGWLVQSGLTAEVASPTHGMIVVSHRNRAATSRTEMYSRTNNAIPESLIGAR